MPLQLFKKYIKLEATGSAVLFLASCFALLLANSPWNSFYQSLLHQHLSFYYQAFHVDILPASFINDGLMVIFFILVGLEIKRELIEGELNTLPKAILPAIAALGGMLVPALIYCLCNGFFMEHLQGWAIPTATDIAFTLGVVALLGTRVPFSLKVFLTALAILDDLGAIVIIGTFYTQELHWTFLGGGSICLALLIALNVFNVMRLLPYVVCGLGLWFCLLKSGIHPTIAGVLFALTIPLHVTSHHRSPARWLESMLHPWVAFVILPLFALVNAGLSFEGLAVSDLFSPLPIGIIAGLFLGKQCGVFGSSWLAIKLGLCKLPSNTTWRELYGAALICGIGFTMSLFIGNLAFGSATPLVKWGVLAGSCLSGIAGYTLLRIR